LAVLLAVLTAVLASFLAGAAGGASGSAQASFPVSVTTAAGKVTVQKAPRRIISLSPTSTETLFALGAGRQVIAVDDQSDYPKSAPRTSLSGFTPNVEAIAGYRPDLVIAAYDTKGLADGLRKLGIPVLIHGPATTIKGAYQQMRQLGAVTGRTAGAAALVARMQKQIAATVARSKSAARGLAVYHEISPDFYSASTKSFVGKVYGLFGLRNIADEAADEYGSGYPQLSAEFIVASSPDVIVLADTVCCGVTRSGVANRPGWSGIKAVRSDSIVRIDDSIASRWGPRLVNFVRAVSTALTRLSA
jgi:iron complex transport system substrate-binding protein